MKQSRIAGYRILFDGHAIQCLRCLRISYNRHDVQHRYCGYCHCFHTPGEAPTTEGQM